MKSISLILLAALLTIGTGACKKKPKNGTPTPTPTPGPAVTPTPTPTQSLFPPAYDRPPRPEATRPYMGPNGVCWGMDVDTLGWYPYDMTFYWNTFPAHNPKYRADLLIAVDRAEKRYPNLFAWVQYPGGEGWGTKVRPGEPDFGDMKAWAVRGIIDELAKMGYCVDEELSINGVAISKLNDNGQELYMLITEGGGVVRGDYSINPRCDNCGKFDSINYFPGMQPPGAQPPTP